MLTKKMVLVFVSIILMLSSAAVASADLSVGVKAGDWIQYQVTFTGTPSPDHSITAARMEVLDVQGPIIKVSIVSTLANGTQVTTNSTLNLETGQLIDNFIIPANLREGDMFLDSNVGNITIDSVEQRIYAGVTRTVDLATSGNNTYIWDQATGISVEGTSTGPDYTMHSLATATNIWQAPSQTGGIDTIIIFVVAAIIVIIIAAAVVVVVIRRKK
jgi:hypothetical protein